MTTLSPLQYLPLNDFTPGIWAGGWLGGIGGKGTIPVPIGAAQETDTWGCIASPAGGLVPLPLGTATSVPVPEPTPASTYFYVNGIRALPTGLHYGITWLENATNNEKFRWYRDGSTATVVVTHTGNAIVPANWTPQAFTTAITRLTSAGNVANISIVGAWSDQLGGGGRTWFFPDPAAPGVDAPAADVNSTGQLFAHQGRILCFTPRTATHGLTGVNTTTTNELINFTDPPQSAAIGAQDTLLSPEAPFGYGAWGSISAGELILIKFHSGGLMMYEDIIYPRVVRLPGIAGTNGFMQEGSFCSAGFLYVSRQSGVFAWTGNNVSQKISTQIDPAKFTPTYSVAGFGSNQFLVHATWTDRVVFPNNWIYDPVLQSWWKLMNPTVSNLQFFSAYGSILYGMPGRYSATPGNQLYTFNPNTLVSQYKWTSQPITIATPGKKFAIREVELIAQPGSAFSVLDIVDVAITSESGTTETLQFVLTTATVPNKIIQQLATPITCSNVTIGLEALGSAGAAPTIHSVNIGYEELRTDQSYYQ